MQFRWQGLGSRDAPTEPANILPAQHSRSQELGIKGRHSAEDCRLAAAKQFDHALRGGTPIIEDRRPTDIQRADHADIHAKREAEPCDAEKGVVLGHRSEEHTSELQSPMYLV